MKNILKKLIFLSLGFCLITSCIFDNNLRYYDLKNNSAKLIYYGTSFSYPDTTLKAIKEFIPTKNSAYQIFPGRVQAQSLSSAFTRNPNMQIFIFDADVIASNPWDTIVKYNMFLKRYQFNLSELQKMGYEINYDGN